MYYRIQQANHPIEWLLDPTHQFSTSYCTDDVRNGVSVCRSIEALAEYFAQVGIPFDETCYLVEVDGERSEDRDEDAELGALLVYPTEIISATPLPESFFEMVFAIYDNNAA